MARVTECTRPSSTWSTRAMLSRSSRYRRSCRSSWWPSPCLSRRTRGNSGRITTIILMCWFKSTKNQRTIGSISLSQLINRSKTSPLYPPFLNWGTLIWLSKRCRMATLMPTPLVWCILFTAINSRVNHSQISPEKSIQAVWLWTRLSLMEKAFPAETKACSGTYPMTTRKREVSSPVAANRLVRKTMIKRHPNQ